MTGNREQRPQGISRRTVTRAAPWSVPVVALAATAPAFASSEPVYAITARDSTGPSARLDGSAGTSYNIVVENLGNQAILPNTLSMRIPIPSPLDPVQPYFISGTSGSWVELSPYPGNYDGRYRTFVYPNAVESRSDGPAAYPYTGALILLFRKDPPGRPDAPNFVAKISTPFVSIDFPMSVPF